MKAAIMQPYFLPYIGYFQLISAVDVFVVYDNIQYTKKGWVNRNRYLLNGADATFSLPLKKDSDFLDVRERQLAPDFNKPKFLNQIREAYRKAPHFAETFPLLESVVMQEETNLFSFLLGSLTRVCAHLGIETPIVISSGLDIDHGLHAQDKVLAICDAVGADTYINPIGGTGLYSREDFARRRIDLAFIRSEPLEYPQFGAVFVPWLSILDVLMFNPATHVRDTLLPRYQLV